MKTANGSESKRLELIERGKKLILETQELADDADHWNRANPDQEPIVVDISYIQDTIDLVNRLESES
jgi:hypothetical protein